MPMVKEKDKKTIQEWFQRLVNPVKLLVFTQEHECEYCQQTREMVEEIASFSDKLSVEVHEFVEGAEVVRQYNIGQVPAVAIVGAKDYGVRFYGFPGGYEFTAFIEDVIDVSTGNPGLSEDTLKELARIDRPVHMQVFTTPT